MQLHLIFINKPLHCYFPSKSGSTYLKRKRIFIPWPSNEGKSLLKKLLGGWEGDCNTGEIFYLLWKSGSINSYLTITKVYFASVEESLYELLVAIASFLVVVLLIKGEWPGDYVSKLLITKKSNFLYRSLQIVFFFFQQTQPSMPQWLWPMLLLLWPLILRQFIKEKIMEREELGVGKVVFVTLFSRPVLIHVYPSSTPSKGPSPPRPPVPLTVLWFHSSQQLHSYPCLFMDFSHVVLRLLSISWCDFPRQSIYSAGEYTRNQLWTIIQHKWSLRRS